MAAGRFAPSPTGALHLGNLRTALVAWLFARSMGSRFLVRMEDLDRATSSRAHADGQLRDLARLGIDWDGDVVFQSDRFPLYHDAIAQLIAAGLTYPCFCSRREIQQAAAAPHGEPAEGGYPGTCRELSRAQLAARMASGRPSALRMRTNGERVAFTDAVAGRHERVVDDMVLRRNDGVPAYHIAVVVDDAAQCIEQVVRGDDLLSSTSNHIHLAHVLGLAEMSYAHVPLVLGPDGMRLAKRDGAVTLADRETWGESPEHVRKVLLLSMGIEIGQDATELCDALSGFDPGVLRRDSWTWLPDTPLH